MIMKIEVDIPEQRIADLMITAIEGNHMTRAWCHGVYLRALYVDDNELLTGENLDAKVATLKPAGEPWYAAPDVYKKSPYIEVLEIIDESVEPEGDNIATHTLNFEQGFRLMAEKVPHALSDFMQENEDAITADVFLQLASLGEVRYG